MRSNGDAAQGGKSKLGPLAAEQPRVLREVAAAVEDTASDLAFVWGEPHAAKDVAEFVACLIGEPDGGHDH